MTETVAGHVRSFLSVLHCGQVALLLRVLGCAPGNFDLLWYDAENRGVSAW